MYVFEENFVSDKKKITIVTCALVGVIACGVGYKFKNVKWASKQDVLTTDDALLALIKHDMKGFQNYVKHNGKLHDELPEIDGFKYTVAEGMAYFDRADFAAYLQNEKISFVDQKKGKDYDILSLAVPRNNPEFFKVVMKENAKFDHVYGDKKWTLLHLASSLCAHKIVPLLHQDGKLNWNTKAKDGATALTIAAESDCLPVLSYWKDHGADFKAKDGRGMSALSILGKKKDAALMAFAESFIVRRPASVVVVAAPKEVSFYRKRVIPKDQKVDQSTLIEPEDRPLEATETAEYSEFAD